MRVRKAVFPAAGWGTRFLPATKAQPKEMLPLVDKPVIQYAVEEAVAAGIEQVIIVTSSQKRAIEDHFDHSFELEHLLESKGDIEMLRRVRQIGDMVQISYVRQKEQLGLGHAVLMAKELVGHEPFAVILSDDVVTGERSCIGQLIEAYQRTGGSVVAVMQVPHEETSRYGVVDPDPEWHRRRRAAAQAPRPRREAEPAIRAERPRHHRPLRAHAQDLREARADASAAPVARSSSRTPSRRSWQEQDVFAYAFEGTRHDAGTTMGWLKASVELALERDGVRRRVPRVPGRGRPAVMPPVRRADGRWRSSAWLTSGASSAAATGWSSSSAREAWPRSIAPADAKLGRDVAVKVLRAGVRRRRGVRRALPARGAGRGVS